MDCLNFNKPKCILKGKSDKSDLEICFDLFSKGKVPREILKNSSLVHICKICKNIYTSLCSFAKHLDHCSAQNIRTRHSIVKREVNLLDPKFYPIFELNLDSSIERNELDISNSNSDIITEDKTDKEYNEAEPIKGFTRNKMVLSRVALAMADIESLSCLMCDKRFVSRYSLKRHMAVVHMSYKKYICDYCEYSSNERISCENHAREFHNGNNRVKEEEKLPAKNCIDECLKFSTSRMEKISRVVKDNCQNRAVRVKKENGDETFVTRNIKKRKSLADEIPEVPSKIQANGFNLNMGLNCTVNGLFLKGGLENNSGIVKEETSVAVLDYPFDRE